MEAPCSGSSPDNPLKDNLLLRDQYVFSENSLILSDSSASLDNFSKKMKVI